MMMVKLKIVLEPATMTQKGKKRYSFAVSLTLVLDVGGSTPRPGRFNPRKETRYRLVGMRLGGPQGQSGQVRKISPATGI